MNITRLSPLRYPGGKARLYPLLKDIFKLNDYKDIDYYEPYAGGAGLALNLLFKALVKTIHINDADLAIFSFWNYILEETDKFCHLIDITPVDIEEWYKQKDILDNNKRPSLQLGFAAFYLNRTNRSGILRKAGPIGGKDQTGKYKIDCRFNKKDLIKRIQMIADKKEQIKVTHFDAEDFMKNINHSSVKNGFLYADPPYYNKGSDLYRNSYETDDHKRISETIKSLSIPWFLTYDNVPSIEENYEDVPHDLIDIRYSLNKKMTVKEFVAWSDKVKFPGIKKDRPKDLP